VVGSTLIAGDGNVVTQTVTIIHQYSRAESEPEEPSRSLSSFPPSPYKGLESFYEEDADRFFGRSAVVDTLWDRLRDLQTPPLPGRPPRPRLLAIIGPSGSGKSSVARAGLIPELARRPVPGQANPRVALVVPDTEPIEALATVLARLATNDAAPAAKTREFAEEITRINHSGVPDGLRRIANVLPGADRHPLIVLVDQFEEVFTGAAESQISLFIETLLDAASYGSGRISRC
jgi:transglutaminase-like putative cysteine protease